MIRKRTHLRVSIFAVLMLIFSPHHVLADDPSAVKSLPDLQIMTEDVYPAWTQVHFEVQPGTWATIIADEYSSRLVSLSFADRGRIFEIPKECLDDLRNPVLQTAEIGLSGSDKAWVRFKTTTFDENGGGQEEKDMTIVRFVVQNGILVQREIIQEKNNNYVSWIVVDLSKGLSKSDIDADRCGSPRPLANAK